MPSPGKVQLNLSVDPDIRDSLKTLCDQSNVSLAQAITDFVKASASVGKLLGNPSLASARPSTNNEEIKVLVEDYLEAHLDRYLENRITDALADNLETINEAMRLNLDELERRMEEFESRLGK